MADYNKHMKVHFVCTGNTYRSRLAEAYLNSKKLKNVKAFSSGTEASGNSSGPIGWIAARLLFKNKLIDFMSDKWQQTNSVLLKSADYTVFFEDSNLEKSKKNFDFASRDFEVWQLEDLTGDTTDIEKMSQAEETFKKIKLNVDRLVDQLKL